MVIKIYIVRYASGKLFATLAPPKSTSGGCWDVNGEEVRGSKRFFELDENLYPNVTFETGPLVLTLEEIFDFPVYACRNARTNTEWISLGKPTKTSDNGFIFEGGCFIKITDDTFPNLTYDNSPLVVSYYQEDIRE